MTQTAVVSGRLECVEDDESVEYELGMKVEVRKTPSSSSPGRANTLRLVPGIIQGFRKQPESKGL